MDIDKNSLRKKFTEEWEKHYKLQVLEEKGFKRQKCKKCGRYFWAKEERELCGDPSCIGYQFIGNPPTKEKRGYIETWKRIEEYFKKNGHGIIKSYPTVARWRDDLYFTIASINDFQPYVVNGEIEPPANPLLVPQRCIRFPDISNVGVSGRHYTNFVMVGQHAFNTEKTGLFYWKEEAIRHDIEYLKYLGIPEEEIIFMEDVWAGGGNFGPSMEYFVRGLELGNCVFMQYEVTPQGARELKTKVIDMGAGLSRLAWITDGGPTSYEVVFEEVIKELKKDMGVSVDEKLFLKYAKISGSLNEEEVDDIEKEKERIAKELGTTKEELFKNLEPLQSLYATADHLLTLLFTVHDGMLPSNSGGGYNLRLILRRVFGFKDRFGFDFDYYKILEGHAKHLRYLHPELIEGVEPTVEVIKEEEKKYISTKEKARRKVAQLISKKRITKDDLILLYKSHGIPPEYIMEEARKKKVKIEVPGNFYNLVREGGKENEEKKKEKITIDVEKYPKTKALYHSDVLEFEGKVLGVEGNWIILDKSAFYPEGGGQVGDKGWINDLQVIDTKKKAGVILHKVNNPKGLKVGEWVKGKVNKELRMAVSRHHTAAHLITAAARKVLGKHVWQAGAYKDFEKAHMDITHYKKITDEEFEKIEKLVNKWILENHRVEIEILPRNIAEQRYGFVLYQGGAVPGKELRIVKIDNIDVEACGGTHQMIKSTSMIGFCKFMKRESVKDGVERIYYKCGLPALEYVQKRENILKESSRVLSVQEENLPKAVERFFKEWKKQKKEIEEIAKEIIELYKERLGGKEGEVILSLDGKNLRALAEEIAKIKGTKMILKNKEGMFAIAVAEDKGSAKEIFEKLKEKGAKGGGNERVISGKFRG